jgi:hypothetical protein
VVGSVATPVAVARPEKLEVRNTETHNEHTNAQRLSMVFRNLKFFDGSYLLRSKKL